MLSGNRIFIVLSICRFITDTPNTELIEAKIIEDGI